MDDLVKRARVAVSWATPGRPVQFDPLHCEEAKGTPCQDWDTSHDLSVILKDGTRYRVGHFRHADDAAFDQAARTLVPAMADRIEALEAEMEARIAEAVKAVREVAKALADAYAVASQCTVEQESMYDEEGVEGWRWTHPDGREWVETGLWDEGPPRHPLVDDALEKLRQWGDQ